VQERVCASCVGTCLKQWWWALSLLLLLLLFLWLLLLRWLFPWLLLLGLVPKLKLLLLAWWAMLRCQGLTLQAFWLW
jgi:hypothetical protein